MKKLNVLQKLVDFTGKPIPDGEEDMILKNVLIVYIGYGSSMDLSPSERTTAYLAGLAIGTGGEETMLEQSQYDVIKKIVDSNMYKDVNFADKPIYALVIHQQAKRMVDAAEEVKE